MRTVYTMITWSPIHEENLDLFADGEHLGTIHTHQNKFHGRNCYLKVELTRRDFDPAPLFAALYADRGRPLHTMVPHPQQEMAAFLLRGGFALRRRCFLMKVKRSDLLAPIAGGGILEYGADCAEYSEACRLLYDQYARDHAPISPLTADFETFCSVLPRRIFCAKNAEGAILHYAFPEENEIAYMGSEDLPGFRAFAEGVLERMFEAFEEVEFEADDIDPVAMTVRGLFTGGDGFSLDTYTYDPEFGNH